MTAQDRFAAVLNRLSASTNSLRVRAYDEARAERDGGSQSERLEEVIVRLEGVAAELEAVLQARPLLKKVS